MVVHYPRTVWKISYAGQELVKHTIENGKKIYLFFATYLSADFIFADVGMDSSARETGPSV